MISECKIDWVKNYEINETQRKEGYKEFKQKIED